VLIMILANLIIALSFGIGRKIVDRKLILKNWTRIVLIGKQSLHHVGNHGELDSFRLELTMVFPHRWSNLMPLLYLL